MNVPPVNIVMTYRPEIIMAFEEAESFTAFSTERKRLDEEDKKLGIRPHTYIFNNTPNSTFLSLTHSFNFTDGASLEVEIIDPEGLFEEAMLDNRGSIEGFLPLASEPYASLIQQKIEDTVFFKKAADYALLDNNNKKLAVLADHLMSVGDDIQALQTSVDKLDLARLNALLDATAHQIKRPVYIAYGVGDELRYWSPPQCYKNIFKVEYSFDGKGVRILKLFLVGLGAHPNLIEGLGISPFGKAFTKGILTSGSSHLLFNKEATKKRAAFIEQKEEQYLTTFLPSDYDNLTPGEKRAAQFRKPVAHTEVNGVAVSISEADPYKPSLHMAVTEAITNFIKSGSGEDNVYVLLPNLDKYLGPYLDVKVKEASLSLNKSLRDKNLDKDLGTLKTNKVVYFSAFRSALEGLGLTLSERSFDTNAGKPVGPITCLNLEQEALFLSAVDGDFDAEARLDNWFEGRQFKAVIQCDYLNNVSFLDKLKQVGDAIQVRLIASSKTKEDEFSPYIMSNPQSETNVSILKIIKENIGGTFSATKPLIFWGDSGLINSYLYARELEINPNELQFSELHPFDVVNGLNLHYMEKVLEYLIIPEGVGPFGPLNTLPKSTDIENDSNKRVIERGSKIPVFTYGFKDPNILDLDIDINAIYTAALTMVEPAINPSLQSTTAVPKVGEKTKEDQMYEIISELKKQPWFEKEAEAWKGGKRDYGVRPFFGRGAWGELKQLFYDPYKKKADTKLLVPPKFERYLDEHPLTDPKQDKGAWKLDSQSGPETKKGQVWRRWVWGTLINFYSTNMNVLKSKKQFSGPNPVKSFEYDSEAMSRRIINDLMKIIITTVPLFHLSTMRRTLWRPCQLICREPTITGGRGGGHVSWFSGLYDIVGFTHTISSTQCNSEFSIVKGTNPSLYSHNKKMKVVDAVARGHDLWEED